MFDDDGERSQAEERGEDLVPKTRDLAAEITSTVTPDEDEDDRLESGLLERRDETADIVVDNETATAFWAAVIYVNVGLLLVTLGPMLAFFRGRVQVGGVMVVLGGFALYRAYTVYRGYTTTDDERSGPSNDDEESAAEKPDDVN